MEASRRRTKSYWLAPVSQRTRNEYRRRLCEQKLMGVVMLVISVLLLWMCGPANEDCGAVFFTAPLGLLLLFSRKIWIM